MFNSLQACRAFAALLVVLHHANHGIFELDKYFGHLPIGSLVDFAPAAIDFFFVLSGFIILYAHGKDIGKPHALAGYLWRRFSRAYLFYWVVLAVVIPVFFLVPQFGRGFERDPDVIVRSILLVSHPQTQLILGVAWTLVYEILFYVLFGVMVLNRRIGVAIFFLWAAGCISFPWLYSAAAELMGTHVYIYRFICSDMHLRFFAGMLACVVLQRARIPAPRSVAVLGAVLFFYDGSVREHQRAIASAE